MQSSDSLYSREVQNHSPRKLLLPLTVLVLAPILVFWNSLGNSFHFDDYFIVANNPGIQQIQPIWRHFTDPRTISTIERITQYRPLLPLSLSLNYFFTGESVAGFRATNIALHILSVFLVFGFLREIISQRPAELKSETQRFATAFFAALLYAVHPVSGYPINYICARDLILMNILATSALWCYARIAHSSHPLRLWIASLAFSFLALFAKTDAVALGLLIFVFEICIQGSSLWSLRPYARALPFFALVLVHEAGKKFLLHFSDFAQAVPSDVSWWSYALTQGKVHVFQYLFQFIIPFGIRLLPRTPLETSLFHWQVLSGITLIALSLGFAILRRASAPLLAFSILAYWMFLAPTSSVVPLFYASADYRPYPSSPYFFFALLIFCSRRQNRKTFYALAWIYVLYASASSIVLNRTWATDESAWRHSVRFGGEPTAQMNLALSLPAEKAEEKRFYFEQALKEENNFVLGHINYGMFLLSHGEQEAGLQQLQYAVSLAPQWPDTQNWLSRGYLQLGRKDEALAAALRAVENDRRNAENLYYAALLAQGMGKHELALSLAKELTALIPHPEKYQELLFLQGFSEQQLGRLPEAAESYQEFLSANPDHKQARINLIYALAELHECTAAINERATLLQTGIDTQNLEAVVNSCKREDIQ